MLTPVQHKNGIYFKREDLACFTAEARPSGAKVRQYLAMQASTPSGTPCLVGCSAASAMQVYVADAAKAAGVPGYIFVPARVSPHPSTSWAIAQGATVHTVRPGYLSNVRAKAKDFGKGLGRYCVRWDPALAVDDVAQQVLNVPIDTKRILVPCGSGLTMASVMLGLIRHVPEPWPIVVGVRVSPMASEESLLNTIGKNLAEPCLGSALDKELLPAFGFVDAPEKYEMPSKYRQMQWLDVPLDPYYAAKAWPHIQLGDLFWIPGRRPAAACHPYK